MQVIISKYFTLRSSILAVFWFRIILIRPNNEDPEVCPKNPLISIFRLFVVIPGVTCPKKNIGTNKIILLQLFRLGFFILKVASKYSRLRDY